MTVVDVINASKWYGEVAGVNNLTLSVEEGGVVGLLGPNGAGKSTLIHLLAGLLKPTRGVVNVFGESPWANARVLYRIGLCPEQEEMYDKMSARGFLVYMARLSGMHPGKAGEAADEMLDIVGLTDVAGRKLRTFSRGMKQRVKVAQALIHRPDFIILDEPLNGTDPIARNKIMEIVKELAAEGRTVLISSHILNEIATMTEEILVMHRGRLLASGNVHEIRGLIDRHPHRIYVRGSGVKKAARNFFELDGVVSIRFLADVDGLEAETKKADLFYAAIQDAAVSGDIKLDTVYSPDDNLEAVFKYLMGG